MLKNTILICAMLFLGSIFEQPLSASELDVFKFPLKSQDIASLKHKIPQTELLRGDFVQKKRMKGFSKEFNSRGKFIFSKQKGLYWEVQKPFEDIYIFTPQGLLQFDDNGQKKQLPSSTHPFFKELSKAFRAAFSGEELQKYFQTFYTPKNSQGQGWVLGLKPKTSSMNEFMSEMILVGDKHLEKITFKESNGDTTQIEFSKVDLNPKSLNKNENDYFIF